MTLKAVALITQQITQYISMTSILPNTSEIEPTQSGSQYLMSEKAAKSETTVQDCAQHLSE